MTENNQYDPVILRDLKSELSRIENKDEKRLIVGEKRYSINDILREIEEKSDFGLEFYKNHVGVRYLSRPRRLGGLNLKEVSFIARVEVEAKRLGLEEDL